MCTHESSLSQSHVEKETVVAIKWVPPTFKPMLAACESQMGWKMGVYYAKHHYTKVLSTNRIFLNDKSIDFEEEHRKMSAKQHLLLNLHFTGL